MQVPTVDDVKSRLRGRLQRICERAGMFAITGTDVQVMVQTLIEDLSFLEGRDGEAEPPEDWKSFWGQCGVVGRFDQTFGETGRYMAEVVSVLAESAHALGHLALDGPTGGAATRLREAAPTWFSTHDVQRSEVEAEFGPPSLTVDRDVACYAPSDQAPGWVFVDYYRPPHAWHYVKGEGNTTYHDEYADDPLVRDVRLPAPTWDEGLVLTPLGRHLRWGPSWWIYRPIDHPSAGTRPTPHGATQPTDTTAP